MVLLMILEAETTCFVTKIIFSRAKPVPFGVKTYRADKTAQPPSRVRQKKIQSKKVRKETGQ